MIHSVATSWFCWSIIRNHCFHFSKNPAKLGALFSILNKYFFQLIVLLTLLTEGVQLDRLGEGGVFGILDNIAAAVAKLDLAGTNKTHITLDTLALLSIAQL